MDSEESLLVLVYCYGKIKKSNRHGVKFTDKEPLSIFIRSTDTLSDLKRNILQKAGLCGAKLVKKLLYKILMTVLSSAEFFGGENTRVVCQVRRPSGQFRGFSAKSPVDDGGGASTSMPVVAPGCLLAAPSLALAPASRSSGLITGLVGGGEPDHVEDAMWDDDPDHISGDSEEDTPVSPPAPQVPSSSGSRQQPPHFSTLNLEAVSQQPNDAHTFGYQGLHNGNASDEFQIGQSFQTKDEAVMSVNDYSIRPGVQYRVMKSDHLKYIGRCKKFGNGCTWMIRVALRQRKSTWEVRRYNGAHTCLATSISSDHRQLDYHVICARIYPLVRADAAVTIKVL
ncbi:uncharacterized protein LOC130948192 [Arachis stenosperma]|uniref:uncharacterized protein LOC130948192 n=1 Tax=Arachis stenosperma TaxID=217475 RepID=UPI0025ACABC2|nr:uncharacterized protein LOC130948192 [Arachis stenosperma]